MALNGQTEKLPRDPGRINRSGDMATGIRVRGGGVSGAEAASGAAIVRAPLGNGAGVFAPNIKLGLFGPRALGSRRAGDVNRSPVRMRHVLFTLT